MHSFHRAEQDSVQRRIRICPLNSETIGDDFEKVKKKKKKKVSANLQSHLAFRWAWKGFAIKLKEGNFHINDLFDEAHLNDKKCCGKGSRFLLMKEVAVPCIV